MSNTFRQVDRETLFLLPPSMEDWLTEGHLARFIVDDCRSARSADDQVCLC